MIGGSSPPRTTSIAECGVRDVELIHSTIRIQNSEFVRLGRQLADHLGLEPGMLWVRVPPEPLKETKSSWSSLECSPPCQGGGRGFKSHRGRLHGAVRKLAKRRSSNLRECLWVRLPPVLLDEKHASAGHWRAPVVVTHPLSSFAGSTPARRTNWSAESKRNLGSDDWQAKQQRSNTRTNDGSLPLASCTNH